MATAKARKQKKTSAEVARPLLGRPGNNVKMGVVGLPNVGKSSMFNILSKLSVAAENFPFCTIDPNVAQIPVPDPRFDWLCEHFEPASRVPPVITVTDIAGLVRGASEGAGLGNAFLSHIRAVDAIYQMVRSFDGDDVTHVEGSIDPCRDIEIISSELMAKDVESVVSAADGMQKNVERGVGGKEKKKEYDALRNIQRWLTDEQKEIRFNVNWTPHEIEIINRYQLLTAKPCVFLINLSKRDYLRKQNRHLPRIQELVQTRFMGEPMIPFSVEFEQEMFDMEQNEGLEAVQAYYQANPRHKSMMKKVLKTGYHALGLVHFFTCGRDEVKGWTIKRGKLAPQAAGVIHTDFERGFIKAEVQQYDDLHELGSEEAVKKAGKLRSQGKNYEVVDGDIMFFKFNA